MDQSRLHFCNVQEAPRRKLGPGEVKAPKPPPNPRLVIFCLEIQVTATGDPVFWFCRPYKAKQHVENVHLPPSQCSRPIRLPVMRKSSRGNHAFQDPCRIHPQLLSRPALGSCGCDGLTLLCPSGLWSQKSALRNFISR